MAILYSGLTATGTHEFVWDVSQQANGIYLVRALSASGEREVREAVLIRSAEFEQT